MRNFYRYPLYRSNNSPTEPPKPPIPPVFNNNPSPPKPQRPNKPPQKKKFNFKSFKKDTCTSLNDVEHFLCDFSTFVKYVKLYKLLK